MVPGLPGLWSAGPESTPTPRPRRPLSRPACHLHPCWSQALRGQGVRQEVWWVANANKTLFPERQMERWRRGVVFSLVQAAQTYHLRRDRRQRYGPVSDGACGQPPDTLNAAQ